jgi:hypothetical protein
VAAFERPRPRMMKIPARIAARTTIPMMKNGA